MSETEHIHEFSYAEQFLSMVQNERPDIWNSRIELGCDAQDHLLRLENPSSCFRFVCVHGTEHELTIHLGDVEHEHFTGFNCKNAEQYLKTFNEAIQFLYEFVDARICLLIQDDNEHIFVAKEDIQLGMDRLATDSDTMAGAFSGHRLLLKRLERQKSREYVRFAWDTPNDETAEGDLVKAKSWELRRRRYCGGVLKGRVSWSLWIRLRMKTRLPLRGPRL